jgi:hypothetical protein
MNTNSAQYKNDAINSNNIYCMQNLKSLWDQYEDVQQV